jgi:lipoyl(octanoyl) transferase
LLTVRHLGLSPYLNTWHTMRDFTRTRHPETPNEIWITEHEPVFTLGQAGKAEHILNAGDIPIIRTDRGGQVTYHGPGQLLFYVLLDIRRERLGVRALVTMLEEATINLLADYGVIGHTKPNAPGVYVEGAKIAALGLRIKRGCSYHGLSLNIAMDLSPFSRINPCGFSGLKVVQLNDLITPRPLAEISAGFVQHFSKLLGYTMINPME